MTTKRTKPLTIDQANAMAAGHAAVSADPVDATLWRVEGDGWTETHEPMGRADWRRFLDEHSGNDHDGSGTGEGCRSKSKTDLKRCPTTHSGKGLHQRIVDVEAGTYRCLFCNETYRMPPKIKTYDAGQGRRVTVPEEAFQDPKPEDLLMDAVRDNFSPQAVAAMAAYLQAANTKDRRVNEQLKWFAEKLIAEVGFAGYDHLLGEVGL